MQQTYPRRSNININMLAQLGFPIELFFYILMAVLAIIGLYYQIAKKHVCRGSDAEGSIPALLVQYSLIFANSTAFES